MFLEGESLTLDVIGTFSYALYKSDYRIHESPVSPEWVERLNFFYIQKYP